MRITFIRHGKADKAKRDIERPLSEVGRNQAEALHARLNAVGARYDTEFDHVISSPAPRAYDTAAIVTGWEKNKIARLETLYPDPTDCDLGSRLDVLFNKPHLGYCPPIRYLNEVGGSVCVEWAVYAQQELEAELSKFSTAKNVAIFGHAVCLQLLAMQLAKTRDQCVLALAQMQLSECEGFVMKFDDDGNAVSVEKIPNARMELPAWHDVLT
jgi:broad specificity phosphatase PhoE